MDANASAALAEQHARIAREQFREIDSVTNLFVIRRREDARGALLRSEIQPDLAAGLDDWLAARLTDPGSLARLDYSPAELDLDYLLDSLIPTPSSTSRTAHVQSGRDHRLRRHPAVLELGNIHPGNGNRRRRTAR